MDILEEVALVELDMDVAECEGLKTYVRRGQVYVKCYSTDWALGGPIIEREGIEIQRDDDDTPENRWYARIDFTNANGDFCIIGKFAPTPLVAAMRCYVASKQGEMK
jgi:hypothetical protein